MIRPRYNFITTSTKRSFTHQGFYHFSMPQSSHRRVWRWNPVKSCSYNLWEMSTTFTACCTEVWLCSFTAFGYQTNEITVIKISWLIEIRLLALFKLIHRNTLVRDKVRPTELSQSWDSLFRDLTSRRGLKDRSFWNFFEIARNRETS